MIISDCISEYAQARVVDRITGRFDWDHRADAILAEGGPDVLVMWAAKRGYSLTYRHGSDCPDHPDDGLTFTLEPLPPLNHLPRSEYGPMGRPEHIESLIEMLGDPAKEGR